MSTELSWLPNFNPCGLKLVGDYGNKFCTCPECNQLPCLRQASYLTATAILKSHTVLTENSISTDYTQTLVGQRFIDINGQIIEVKPQNISHLTDAVVLLANEIVSGIKSCVRNTLPFSPEDIHKLPIEEQKIFFSLAVLSKNLKNFHGTEAEARQLAVEIQDKLKLALEHNLGRFDLIASMCLIFGLADESPGIDESGLILIGEPRTIVKIN